MLRTILIIAAIVIGILLLIGLIIFFIRSRRFRPNPRKLQQQAQLNNDLESAGFAYDLRGDYFYSLMDCWQREMGYCRLYDEGAALFNMIMDCEPITFSYAGKRWLIELWKGQYGITTGAEIGIYNTVREDINHEKFQGTFYEAIRNEERLPLSFILKRNGKEVFRRSAVHWWITGFKLGEYSSPSSLTLDAKITFPNREMCSAFLDGLKRVGYTRQEFSVRRRTVIIHYTTPHTKQPVSRNKVQEALVQQTNENNCRLFEFATARYSDTLDKLEYAKAVAPELYQLFFHSLYARGVYEAFDWLIELIGDRPIPEPIPPEPIPPCKPPKPPCKPPVPPCKPPVPPCKPCDPCVCPPNSCVCPPNSCVCPPNSCVCPPNSCVCPPNSCVCPPNSCSCVCPPDSCVCPPNSCSCVCPPNSCVCSPNSYVCSPTPCMYESDPYTYSDSENGYYTDDIEPMEEQFSEEENFYEEKEEEQYDSQDTMTLEEERYYHRY